MNVKWPRGSNLKVAFSMTCWVGSCAPVLTTAGHLPTFLTDTWTGSQSLNGYKDTLWRVLDPMLPGLFSVTIPELAPLSKVFWLIGLIEVVKWRILSGAHLNMGMLSPVVSINTQIRDMIFFSLLHTCSISIKPKSSNPILPIILPDDRVAPWKKKTHNP